MTESQKLLTEYVANGSETAFQELVARYINFVYSTARRLVGQDSHLAEDVTQLVFINLAKKGRTLSREVWLGGWLHQHTYHVATKAVRNERRRQSREREALEMKTLQDDSEASVRKIEPILDEAITQLGSEDRAAILLRFFEQRDFRAVGEALGSNEDAARMRVNRALAKLQVLLKRRGVRTSAASLAIVLATGAVSAAPAGLSLSTSSVAIASVTAGAGGVFARLMSRLAMPGPKFGIATLVIVAILTTIAIYNRAQGSRRAASKSSRLESPAINAPSPEISNVLLPAADPPAPRLPTTPAPLLPAGAAADAGAGALPESTGLPAFIAARTTKLTRAQVEPFLDANRRNAASLLAAFRTTDDPALLEEAMQKYPNDPQVSFEALLKPEVSPAERRQWLDAVEQSVPDNALPNYLSALDHFKAGQVDQAVRELVTAASKPQFQDYSLSRALDDEEAYRTAGRSDTDAKIAATTNLRVPQLVQIRELSRAILELANSSAAGDDASRRGFLQMAANLGRRYRDGSANEPLISQLVGITVERAALNAMDPDTAYGAPNQTVRDRINELIQQRAVIRNLNKQAEPLWPGLSDLDWTSYLSRSQVWGGQRALQWLVDQSERK